MMGYTEAMAMTTYTAQQLGIAAAREAYRQWDRLDDASEIVMAHLSRLDTQLRLKGLTDDDDDLWGAAGEAYRAEAGYLFGRDHIVAGQ